MLLSFLSHYVRLGRLRDLEDCLRDSPSGRGAINALGRDARTLLGTAAERGDVACCKVLLEFGADPAGTPGQNRTPLELAREKGNTEVIHLIERALNPEPPPPADLPELDLDLDLGFDLGPIEEEAPIVVNEPAPAVWAALRQRNQQHDRSAPVEADLELELDAFFLGNPDELLIGGLPPHVVERLRAVVIASMVEGRVRRSALIDALDSPRSEREETRMVALIDVLAARVAQAGALAADPVWDAVDPLVIEQPPEARWDGEVRAARGDGADDGLELPELVADPLDGSGLDLPLHEVLAAVDEIRADTEAAWWAKAYRARARPKSEPEGVLHSRLENAQEQLVVGVSRWLESLPPADRASAHDALLAGGDAGEEAEVEAGTGADALQSRPQVVVRATGPTSDDFELGEDDEPTEELDGQAGGPAAAASEEPASKAPGKKRALPALGRNNMEVWLPRLRVLAAADLSGRRPCPPQELLESARRIQALMVELVEQHLPLVRDTVTSWRWAAVDVDDLIQQGNLGLWRALYTYRPEDGAFATYSRWWIRARITRYIRMDGDLHLSSGMAERADGYEAALEWRRRSQPGARWSDVAAWMELDIGSLLQDVASLALVQGRVSWQDLEAGEGPAATGLDPADAWELSVGGEVVRRALANLEPREQEVLRLRFGLGRDDEHTLSMIGDVLDLSRERIRQIETKALERLRKVIEGVAEDPGKPGRRRRSPAQMTDEPATPSDGHMPVVAPVRPNPAAVPRGNEAPSKPDRRRRYNRGR
jgi:RNA polymerase sigma factor (sigma-70 family)